MLITIALVALNVAIWHHKRFDKKRFFRDNADLIERCRATQEAAHEARRSHP